MDMNKTPTAYRSLTIPAAAARVGVTETDLREAIAQGRIPSHQRQAVGVLQDDVDQWAQARQATS